jgi:hypothetical protein
MEREEKRFRDKCDKSEDADRSLPCLQKSTNLDMITKRGCAVWLQCGDKGGVVVKRVDTLQHTWMGSDSRMEDGRDSRDTRDLGNVEVGGAA